MHLQTMVAFVCLLIASICLLTYSSLGFYEKQMLTGLSCTVIGFGSLGLAMVVGGAVLRTSSTASLKGQTDGNATAFSSVGTSMTFIGYGVLLIPVVFIIIYVLPGSRQERAVYTLKELVKELGRQKDGGFVGRNNKPTAVHDWYRDGEVIDVCFSGTDFDDSHAALLKSLYGLKKLDLSETRITDVGIRNLKKLPNLEELDLSGSPVGDASLKSIATLTNLKILRLDRCNIGDQGIEYLKGHSSLREVYLTGDRLSEKSVELFSTIESLEWLRVEDSNISESSLHIEAIQKHPSLRGINLDRPKNGNGFKWRKKRKSKKKDGPKGLKHDSKAVAVRAAF